MENKVIMIPFPRDIISYMIKDFLNCWLT